MVKVNIGLDIGTSTSKVVISSKYTTDNNFYVVNFGELGVKGATYLLPTVIAKKNKSDVGFQSHYLPKFGEKKCYIRKDLKIRYLKNPNNTTVRNMLTWYIARVLEYSINWFLNNYGNKGDYATEEIEWFISAGIPTKDAEDKKIDNFTNLITEAYKLLNTCQIYHVEIHPEIYAAMQFYVNRDSVQPDGFYGAIDVGAGTVDIAMFTIVSDNLGRPTYNTLAADVKYLGANMYKDEMIKVIKEYNHEYADYLDKMFSKQNKIPEDKSQYCCGLANKNKIIKELEEKEENFKKKFRKQLGDLMNDVRMVKNPLASVWQGKGTLLFFVSGGGSNISLYKEVIKDISESYQKRTSCNGIEIIDVDDTKVVSTCSSKIDKLYTTVAIGLSSSDIFGGTYVPPSKIPNSVKWTPKVSQPIFVSKDMT